MNVPDWMRFRREERADASYSDTLIRYLQANTAGITTTSPQSLGPVELAAGFVARSFSVAEVKGAPDNVLAALSPLFLASVGRSLIKQGECLYLIQVANDGSIELTQAAAWDISGGLSPSSWRYSGHFATPDGSRTFTNLPADSVLAIRHNVEARAPWRGRSSLDLAVTAAQLASHSSEALRDEMSGPRGSVMAMPVEPGEQTAALEDDLRGLRGELITTRSMMSDSTGDAPKRDFEAARLGATLPAPNVSLRKDAAMELTAALGLPVEMLQAADGTAAREGFRRALWTLISPLGVLCQSACREALMSPDLTVQWSELRASDIQGRARSFSSMYVGGKGLTIADAARNAGLNLEDDYAAQPAPEPTNQAV